MSGKTVETVLIKAMNDAAFAESLFANAEEALAGFDLTRDEIENFKGMSRESFDEYVKSLPEERKSMAGGPPRGTPWGWP